MYVMYEEGAEVHQRDGVEAPEWYLKFSTYSKGESKMMYDESSSARKEKKTARRRVHLMVPMIFSLPTRGKHQIIEGIYVDLKTLCKVNIIN